MHTHITKAPEDKSQPVTNTKLTAQSKSTFQFSDNRPEATSLKKLQQVVKHSPKTKQLSTLKQLMHDGPQSKPAPQHVAPQGSPVLQLKLDKIANAAALKPIVAKSQLALEALNMPEVVKFIDNVVIPDVQNWDAHSSGDPTLWVDKTKKSGKIWILKQGAEEESLSSWLIRLSAKYKSPDDSVSGFAVDHSAQVATKTAHKDNWEVFVTQHLAMIPVIGHNLLMYNQLHTKALAAAKELDNKSTKDAASRRNEVHAFGAYIGQFNKTTDVRPSIPVWSTESKYGTGLRVQATYFPGYTMAKGSGDSIATPIDWFYSGRTEDGVGAYYVKGHLLNDHVGGLAKNYNLSPLKANRNKQHEAAIEHNLKESVRLMTKERAANLPLTYKQIEYTTELGPQSGPRPITLKWKNALGFWNLQKTTPVNYAKLTLQDLLAASNVPDDVKDVIKTWNLNYFSTKMAQVYPWVHTSALLLETEDYLVRDWTVHLRYTYADGTKEDEFAAIKNEKLDHLKVLVKSELDTTPILDATKIVTDTSHKSAQRPSALKKMLYDMPEQTAISFLEYLSRHPQGLFNIMDFDLVEKHPELTLFLMESYNEFLGQQQLKEGLEKLRVVVLKEPDGMVLQELCKRLNIVTKGDINAYKIVLLEYLAGIKVISDVEFVLRQLDTARVIVETHRRREEHAAASQIVPFFGLPQQGMQGALVPYGMSQGSSSGLEAEHTHPGYEGAPGGLPSMSATDILMQSFKDLMKFEEGQYMLQQAISYMQRSNPLYQLINTNAWSLILGRLLGALNSKNPGEVTAAMNQGDAFLKAQTNVDVAKEVRNQELLPYIKLLAQDYKVDKMQIIEALNDPEPNIRLDMLNRLEWKKRLLLTE